MNDETGNGDLRERVKTFALRVIRLSGAVPRTLAGDVILRQLVRSATSAGAQHREAYRSRSTAEFISKMESAVQELDESSYWIELLVEANLVTAKRLGPLLTEADELTAIFVASVKTAKRSRTQGGR
jgi:four helix bundle protein